MHAFDTDRQRDRQTDGRTDRNLIVRSRCIPCSVVIKLVWFASVSVSVRLRALTRSHFLVDFHQNWHRRNPPPRRKNEFVRRSISHHPFPYFAPQNPHLGQKVLKTHANIKQCPISALNVRKLPKFRVLQKIRVEEHDGDIRF